MSPHSTPDLERQLLLETTLFQEETTPEALNSLLDQLEKAPTPFSPKDEWARFQAAHPEHFPRRHLRRAIPWAAAACLALAVLLPASGLLPRAVLLPASGLLPRAAETPLSQGVNVQTAEDRAVLYQLAGITPLRAELPFDGELVEGPAAVPFADAELYHLPFYLLEEEIDPVVSGEPEPAESP